MSAPYKKLYTYWYSIIVYDLTVQFTNQNIRSWKLKEQMTGAARSGKQNIVEGSDFLKVSLKTGIKLNGVAKSSFEELIGDLEDYLRQNKLVLWNLNDDRVRKIRDFNSKQIRNLSILYQSNYEKSEKTNYILSKYELPVDSEVACNLLLTLCHQVTFLLDKQIDGLIKKHAQEGGLTEKLYKNRTIYRKMYRKK